MKSTVDKKKIKKLSLREQTALLFYIENKCDNMKAACVKAGYTEKSAITIGTKLLQKELAVQFIEARVKKALQKYSKSADDVLDELSAIGFADFKDYFNEDANGIISLKTLSQLGRHSRAIKEIKHVKRDVYGPEGQIIATINDYTYKLHDKVEALKHLGIYHQLFAKIDASKPNEGDNKLLPMVYLPDNGKGGKAVVMVEYKAN